MTISSAVALAVIAFLLAYSFSQVLYLRRKLKMHKKEKELKESGNYAYGSSLCHGMVVNEDETGVVSDSKKTSSWYSRLV